MYVAYLDIKKSEMSEKWLKKGILIVNGPPNSKAIVSSNDKNQLEEYIVFLRSKSDIGLAKVIFTVGSQ